MVLLTLPCVPTTQGSYEFNLWTWTWEGQGPRVFIFPQVMLADAADVKTVLSESQPDKVGGLANGVGKQLVRRKEASD